MKYSILLLVKGDMIDDYKIIEKSKRRSGAWLAWKNDELVYHLPRPQLNTT